MCHRGMEAGSFIGSADPQAERRQDQPLALGGGFFEAKVSFHPLGVSCQMSLLG